MIRKMLLAASLVAANICMAQKEILFTVKELPAYHPQGSNVFLAGSFNGWNPADEKFKFTTDNKGHYLLKVQLDIGTYEYKITRGAWDKVETNMDGANVNNRNLQVQDNTTIPLSVTEWADRFPATKPKSTASKNVQVLDTAFLIPQLKRTRRITVYLPGSYESNPKKRYPVLYMQDGQNLFDEATSFSGEWGVDEHLNTQTFKECIVVAIDHGNAKRLTEYNPYNNERFGKGEGKEYVSFLATTLKPFIDKKFRTNKSREKTFIAGSSMGGLISLYAIMTYPKVFGAAGVFSPAFHVAGDQLLKDIEAENFKQDIRLFFYAGKLESDNLVNEVTKVADKLRAHNNIRISTLTSDEGRHTEADWKRAFPEFYYWLMR
jgi:predicted alpha/beta superfamily hydrolase